MIRMLLLVLWVLFLAMGAFAVVDLVRRPAAAFPAVDRQSKVAWGIFLGLALLVILLFGTNFLGIIGLIVIMFYLVDVRPKVRDITAGR